MNKDKITMSKYDFWCLRNAHERLAIKSGDVSEMVSCAKVRMNNITTSITCGGREGRLPYEEDNENLYVAFRLLNAAKDTELEIAKSIRESK